MLNINHLIQAGSDPVGAPTTAHNHLETALRKVELTEDMSRLNCKEQNNKTFKSDNEDELIVSTGTENGTQDEDSSDMVCNDTQQKITSISDNDSTLTGLSECSEDSNIIKLDLSQPVSGTPNADAKGTLEQANENDDLNEKPTTPMISSQEEQAGD